MTYRSLLFLLISLGAILPSNAELNEKFIKGAAQEVWGMNLPDFNPAVEIPDSISENQSAVIIAEFVFLEGDFNQSHSYSKQYNIGSDLANMTSRKLVRRRMIKLLDESAVEQFSAVDIGTDEKVKINTYELAKQQEAFGARIHKPDGKVENIDVMKALAVSQGKKGKDEVSYKLQIPGLAVGDVLEYFTYVYDEIDELSMRPLRIDIIQPYPIMKYEFMSTFDPALTVEYRSVNGAPLMGTKYDSDGNLQATIQFSNLPPKPSNVMFLKNRQLPYYRFSILNNNSEMVWRPKLSRGAGLYPDVATGTYYREIGEVLNRFTPNEALVKLTEKYMKSYIKAHPDESRRDLIDRAWVASAYYLLTDKKISGSDLTRSRSFREVLRKLKLDDEKTGIAFVNERRSFPTDCLLSYTDVDYFPVADGVVYCATDYDACAPGEMPGYYQGEAGGVYYSDFRDPTVTIQPATFEVPTTSFNKNVLFSEVNLKINVDEDDMPLEFNREVTASGATKGKVRVQIGLNDWAAQIEDYLQIPESDRYKPSAAEKKLGTDVFEEFLMDDAESVMGVRPAKISENKLVSLGCVPTAKKLNYSMAGTLEGLVSDAGDGELLVNIGRLFGKNTKLLGSDRQRKYDAIGFAPHQYVYKVNLQIPDGYTVNEAAIESLNNNVQNPIGCYNVGVIISEDGRELTFNVIERTNTYVIPADHWDELLELQDTAANFNETSIVLTPAK